MTDASKIASRTEAENKSISEFLSKYFGADFEPTPARDEEQRLITSILAYVEGHFDGTWIREEAPGTSIRKRTVRPTKYVLGLALDFAIVAQQVLSAKKRDNRFSPEISFSDIEKDYQILTARGGTDANTLTFKIGDSEFGIRTVENAVVDLFHGKLGRLKYPSAYGYNTGQWRRHRALLTRCFSLSKAGRYHLSSKLFDLALRKLAASNTSFAAQPPRVFEAIVERCERAAKGENGGLLFQGIAYGYHFADNPMLAVVADKVRTGSSRQRRFGDIDCYYGLQLEIAAEVKDYGVKANDQELLSFAERCNDFAVPLSIAFVHEASDDARSTLSGRGLTVISRSDLLAKIKGWDWQKQERAVHGLLHYLSHIEQNENTERRVLGFIESVDPYHPSLNNIDVTAELSAVTADATDCNAPQS